ncbi:MAG: preprotein translocase subunit SecY, partial [Catalinimonas sp.]
KPGEDTTNFISQVLDRITLPGSIFLAIVAILPAFASVAGVNREFAQFFGGTSLLIMVGVILDTLQQIESYLRMKQYDSMMGSSRLRGRSRNVAVAS